MRSIPVSAVPSRAHAASTAPSAHSHPSPRRRPSRAPNVIEPLERRALLAVSVSAVATGSGIRTVTITGDTLNAGDDINITQTGATGDITVSGTAGDGTPFNVTRLNVEKIIINSRTGTDDVTYTLANSAVQARDLIVEADLGSGNDRFVADLTRDITASDSLTIRVQGAGGNDNLHLNADTFTNTNGMRIGGGGALTVDYFGGADTDSMHLRYAGELDGRLHLFNILDQFADTGHDLGTITAVFQAGSSTSAVFDGRIEGGLFDDELRLSVGDNTGGNVDVNAHADGGFNFFDNDIVRHTNNVTVSNAEQNIIVNSPAFQNRAVTSPVALGTPTTLSGIITEPDLGDTFFLDIDWGDGATETITFLPGTFVSGETLASIQHTYDHVGKYNISLTWRDQTGLSNSDDTLVAKVLPHAKQKHKG
jgi:hypothetical protein